MDQAAGINLENIPRRIPVLNKESVKKFPDEKIDQQWNLTTETIKREIQIDRETREAIIPFVSSPVSEDLPNKVVQATASVNGNIGRLEQRFQELGQYLALPAVPDELIPIDLKNVPAYADPEETYTMYAQWEYGMEQFQKLIDRGRFLRGITSEELAMVTKRYRLARDIKLLALAGEMIEIGPISLSQNGEATLKSGTRIFMNPDKVADHNELLNPLNWIKRKTIKDRVYEIEVAGKKCILKEKKTARHTDTKRHGHKEGLSSGDEFKTATFFNEHGTLTQEGITVSWEDPIGYVVFPDGFQFTVFEFEKDLINHGEAVTKLFHEIIQHRDQFESEFQEVAKHAKKLRKHRATRMYADDNPNLSFESFARAKAMYWTSKANRTLENTVTSNNYGNSDYDGYAYRIHEEPRLSVEIVGMDFEYFYPLDPKEGQERLQREKEFWHEHVLANGIFMSQWWDKKPVTKGEQAAFLALYLIDNKRL